MSIALIIQVLLALFRFPTELSAFVRLISKSPEEKRQEILARIQAESDKIDQEGRPSWES